MGTACSKGDNREANKERRRRREEELGVTPRSNDDGRPPLAQSTTNYPSFPPTPMNAFYDPYAASIAAQQRQYLASQGSQPNRPPLVPSYASSLYPSHMPPPTPSMMISNTQPPAPARAPGGKKSASRAGTPKGGPPTHTSYGGGSVTPRSRRASDASYNNPSARKPSAGGQRSKSSGLYVASGYGASQIGLRPQIIQALGLLETEEIQQRLDMQAAEREEGISVALMFEWLPEACAIQNKLREIVDLERMSRVAILRQESASMDAFIAWTRELLEDSRLTMYVSRTLQRQHIPSPPRGRGISPMRGGGADNSTYHAGQYSYPAMNPPSANASAIQRNPSPLVFRNSVSAPAPSIPKYLGAAGLGPSPRKPSPTSYHRRQSSIHDLPEDTTFFSTGEGKAVGSASSRQLPHAPHAPHAPTSRATMDHKPANQPSNQSEYRPSTMLPCAAGDPRFLCFHPPHSLDMQQRRAASEERAKRAKQEHDEISRLAAMGAHMYGREEEELMAKIARQKALADHSKGIYKSAPVRAAPPPPSADGRSVAGSYLPRLPPADASGLNSPPRTAAPTPTGPVPWYVPSPNPHLKPHPTGPNYSNSANDFSYISGSAAADMSTLNASALGTVDNSRWQSARDASARATRSRLSALGRE